MITAPTGRDASLVAEVLGRTGLDTQICKDVAQLCAAADASTSVVLLAEEALDETGIDLLLATLRAQEPWSDLPILLLTSAPEHFRRRQGSAASQLTLETSVTLLERPFRRETLISATEAALRARRRQWEIRDLLRERELAGDELRRSGERLAMALQAGQSGIFRWDAKTNTNVWSRELEALYGMKPGEFGGLYEDWLTCLVPEDMEHGDQAVRRSLQTGFFTCEFRIRRHDTGEVRWMDGRGQVFYDAEGHPDYLIGTNVDITERKRAEEAQLRGAAQQKILSESLARLLASDDPEKLVHDLFPKVAAHLGTDTYFNFLVNDMGDALRMHSCGGISDEQAWQIQRLEFGQAICGTVAIIRQPIIANDIQHSQDPRANLVRGMGIQCYACNPLLSGAQLLGTLSFASRTRPQFDEDELEFLRLIANYVALALERARASRALRLSEAQLRAIYDGTHEYIGLVALDGTLLEVNRAALDFAGSRLDHVLGHPFWEGVWFQHTPGAPERVRHAIEQAAQGIGYRGELTLRHPSGEDLTFDFLFHPIYNEAGQVFLIVPEAVDITERKRSESALREAKEQAENASAAKDPGVTYGQTDDFGFSIASDPVHVNDFHATLLHLMGIQHERFTYRFQGRDYRLTDVAGKVVKGVLA